MSHHHLEAAVSKLSRSSRDTAVVLDAKNFLSRFRHPSPPPTVRWNCLRQARTFLAISQDFMSRRCAVVNCEKTTTNLG